MAFEHAMTVVYMERTWKVCWEELQNKVTIYQVSSDSFGNSILNKKIKTLTPEDANYPTISDGNSFLSASLSLVEQYSSKTPGYEYFIGTK